MNPVMRGRIQQPLYWGWKSLNTRGVNPELIKQTEREDVLLMMFDAGQRISKVARQLLRYMEADYKPWLGLKIQLAGGIIIHMASPE